MVVPGGRGELSPGRFRPEWYRMRGEGGEHDAVSACQRKGFSMKVGYIVFLLLLIGFGAASSLDVAESVFVFTDDYLGASGFPRLFGIVLILLCVIELVRILIEKRFTLPEDSRISKKMYLAVGISCLFVLGFAYLGFVVTAFPYLILMSLVFVDFNPSYLKGIVLYSAAVTLVCYSLFKAAKVYLPDTILF
ncbi:MAG: tripartite tricarboxylate transporter TctB family protein [Planctomycetes bacterium]|nr:tripartite tricarboxylate transporter TctB family protein [Planctomycetota bacterium]